MSWGRTLLALFVASMMFLRWYPTEGPITLVPALLCAVAGLLEDRPRASSMGLSGRRWVLENWRWEDLARDMQRVLSGE